MGKAADRLGRIGKNLRTLPDVGVQFATKTVRASAPQALREDAGSDRRLSGVRNGRAQTVTVTTRERGQLVVGRVMAGPASQRAPWFWMEEGTASGRRGSPVGRYRSRRAYRGWHPGTPAKRTWSRGVGVASEKVRAEFDRLFRKAVQG